MARWHRRRGHRVAASVWTAAGTWLLTAARAQAHTTFPGLGEYGSGFLHPLTTPPHLLVLLALGLWLGQHPPLRLREPVAVFAVTATVGLLTTAFFYHGGIPAYVLAGLALVIGAGVAVGQVAPFWTKLAVCGVAALLLGLDSGVDAGTPPAAATKILLATGASLVLCLINFAFYVSLLPAARPAQTGVRVLGSWIVAIALLLLAFALRR